MSPSESWAWVEAPLGAAIIGSHAVYVVARGSGSVDLRAFVFARP